MRYRPGVTLVEVLVVVFIIGLTGFIAVGIMINSAKLYARTNVHIEPQASVMLAFKRMEREIRQSMLISTTTPTPSTWVAVTMPQKGSDGLNQVTVDSNGRLKLVPGTVVNYFLGTKVTLRNAALGTYLASPSGTGTSLFRAESTYNSGSNTFDNAKLIIDAIVNPNDPNLDNDPALSRESLANTLFVYTPYYNNGTPDDYLDDRPLSTTKLITITLVVKAMQSGRNVYHPLWTQFTFQNLH